MSVIESFNRINDEAYSNDIINEYHREAYVMMNLTSYACTIRIWTGIYK